MAQIIPLYHRPLPFTRWVRRNPPLPGGLGPDARERPRGDAAALEWLIQRVKVEAFQALSMALRPARRVSVRSAVGRGDHPSFVRLAHARYPYTR
jgi:hypothetical protein